MDNDTKEPRPALSQEPSPLDMETIATLEACAQAADGCIRFLGERGEVLWASMAAGEWYGPFVHTPLLEDGDLQPGEYEISIACADTETWWALRLTPLRDRRGNLRGMIEFGRDITAAKTSNASRHREESRAEALFRAMPDLMFRFAADGRIVDYHAPEVSLLYRMPEDFIGRKISEVLPDTLARETLRNITLCLETGRLRTYGYELSIAGETHYFETRMTRSGPDETFAIVRDVTAQRNAENTLRENERLYRMLAENSSDAIWQLDTQLRFTYLSPSAINNFGIRSEDIGSFGLKDLLFPDDFARIAEKVQLKMRNAAQLPALDSPFRVELRQHTNDGSLRWLEIASTPLFDGHRNLIGFQGITRDVTERKLFEQSLHDKENRLETFHEIDRAILQARSPEEVSLAALTRITQLIRVTGACVVGFNVEEGVARVHALIPALEQCRLFNRDLPLMSLPFAGALLRGEFGIEAEVLRLPLPTDIRQVFALLKIRAAVGIPLVVERNQVIGALALGAESLDRFTMEDLAAVQDIADSVAIALLQTQLYRRIEADAQAKELLLREMNHRVKNNLSAIIGMLYAERSRLQSPDRAAHREILDSLAGRVQGLATVHSLLSSTQWRPLLLHDLCEQVIQAVLQGIPAGKRAFLHVTRSQVRIGSNPAHHLAIVLNELAGNVVNHVLKTFDSVTIAVEIAPVGEGVRLLFKDDGPGFPPAFLDTGKETGTASIGLELLRNLVERNLGGTFALRSEHGACVEMEFTSGLVRNEEAPS